MFILKDGVFSKINDTIKIVKNDRKQHQRELTLGNYIESSPLDKSADFIPTKTCRIIIIKDEGLQFERIDSNDIVRDFDNKKFRINSYFELITPGNLSAIDFW